MVIKSLIFSIKQLIKIPHALLLKLHLSMAVTSLVLSRV